MKKVKVCGMRDRQNIIEILAAGPDFMGFIFYQHSMRYVGNELDNNILQTFPPAVRKVGVFVNEKSGNILEICRSLELDLVQLHGDESPEYCKGLHSFGIKIIKAFGIMPGFDFKTLDGYRQWCHYFLFDTRTIHYGGSSEKFNWELIEAYNGEIPFFLSGGIGPDDLQAIRSISNQAFYAIDINSRFETAPGIKDALKVNRFIKEIKQFK
jgi:phosphoribosylanthranilate isomerase